MTDRMSDEEFESDSFSYMVQSNPVYHRLHEDHKRAREAELKLSLDNKFHEINRDDAATIIADLEKENKELKGQVKSIYGAIRKDYKQLVKENVELKEINKSLDRSLSEVGKLNAELKGKIKRQAKYAEIVAGIGEKQDKTIDELKAKIEISDRVISRNNLQAKRKVPLGGPLI